MIGVGYELTSDFCSLYDFAPSDQVKLIVHDSPPKNIVRVACVFAGSNFMLIPMCW